MVLKCRAGSTTITILFAISDVAQIGETRRGWGFSRLFFSICLVVMTIDEKSRRRWILVEPRSAVGGFFFGGHDQVLLRSDGREKMRRV
jgi:hypothetical protein